MKFLVTGGCGFIGSNLVDKLISHNHEVIVIDNLSSDAHENFYFNIKAKYYHCDINDIICSTIFETDYLDGVFHLAAEARIQNCIEDPSLCIKTNVMGTQNILELSSKNKINRMVFMSTSAIYGLQSKEIQTETDVPDCLNAYSYSKLFGEQLCKLYSSLYGLDTVCFRGFNIYGPRQPTKGQYAPIMGIFLRQKKNKQDLTIVGDGTQKRDFIHVDDICSALIRGMMIHERQNGEVYNLGTGNSYSINEIADMIGGNKIYIPPRKGEAKITNANTIKIKSKLNWNHSISMRDYINDMD
jgi:UDP-glucose 4-epimerase